MVDLHCKCTTLGILEHFMGGSVAETFSRSIIESFNGGAWGPVRYFV